jgi:ComF family protein
MAVDTGRCGSCLTSRESPAVGQCVVAVDYVYPWDHIVAQFKFRQQPGWAQPLAALMLRAPLAGQLMSDCDAVVPVPLTPIRLASRGYNQSWELVKALHRQARRSQTKVAPTIRQALLRRVETPDQHSLPREQRMRNLRGVFLVNPPESPRVQGSHLLLVDDVTTTGATLEAAGQALLAAGAARVSALVFARTPAA